MSASKASFRGVAFGVDEAELSGGRRTVIHELPLRESPFVEDMGLKARAFNVGGFVVGPDYAAKRDQLLEALEKPGSGVLVHPYFGTMNVQVVTFNVSEGKNLGLMAKFEMTFTQTQAIVYPTQGADLVSRLTAATSAARDAVAESTEAAVDVSDSRLAAAAEALGKNQVAEIQAKLSPEIMKAVKINPALLEVADRFTRDLNRFVTDISVLVRRPLEYAFRVQAIIRRLTDVSIVTDSVDTYVRLYSSMEALVDGALYQDTARGRKEEANARALNDPAITACATSAAEIAARATYSNRRQADDTRAKLFTMLESIMERATNDTLYQSVYDLRLAVSATVPPPGYRLKDVVERTVSESMPAILLSYQLYGTPDYDEDIVARNNIRHPGMVQGGSKIEVVL